MGYFRYFINDSRQPLFAVPAISGKCFNLSKKKSLPEIRKPDFSIINDAISNEQHTNLYIIKNEEIILCHDETEDILYIAIGKSFKTKTIRNIFPLIMRFNPDRVIVPTPILQASNPDIFWIDAYNRKCANLEKFVNDTVIMKKSGKR